MRDLGQTVHFFHRDGINLIVHIQTRHVLAIPFNHINELVDGDVLTDCHIRVVNFVIFEELLDKLFGESLCQIDCGRKVNSVTAGGLLLEGRIEQRLVETNAKRLQLSSILNLQPPPSRIQHENDKVGSASGGDDLPSSTFSSLTFDDTRQIKI